MNNYAERDAAIFAWSETGMRQKAIAHVRPVAIAHQGHHRSATEEPKWNKVNSSR